MLGVQKRDLAAPSVPREPTTWPCNRGDFLARIPKDKKTLEIGPYYNPTLLGENIRYFDVLSTEQIRDAAVASGVDVSRAPHIHHCSPTGDLASITDTDFEQVYSSHNIEHQPNLVKHLQDVANLMGNRPGGRFFVFAPDKRYCFDAKRPLSTLGRVLEAYLENHTFHTLSNRIDFGVYNTHNDASRHWNNDSGVLTTEEVVERAQKAIQEYNDNKGKYLDTHAWAFTPMSFSELITQIFRLGYSPFIVEHVSTTRVGDLEFNAVLRIAG